MEMRNVLNQVLIPYFSIFYLLTAPNFLYKFLCQSCRLFLALVIHNFRISKLAFDTGLWNGMPSGTSGKWDFAQPQLKYSTHCYHAILGSENLLAQWQLLCSREPGFQPKSVSKIDVHSTVHNASAPWRNISSSKGRSSLASSRVNCKVVMGTFTMLAGIIQIYVVTPFFSWWSVWMLWSYQVIPSRYFHFFYFQFLCHSSYKSTVSSSVGGSGKHQCEFTRRRLGKFGFKGQLPFFAISFPF